MKLDFNIYYLKKINNVTPPTATITTSVGIRLGHCNMRCRCTMSSCYTTSAEFNYIINRTCPSLAPAPSPETSLDLGTAPCPCASPLSNDQGNRS